MRNLILLSLILLITKDVYAQADGIRPMPNTYTETVTINKTKAQLYSRAKEWFAKTTPITHYEVQMDDKVLGRVIAKATLKDTLQSNVIGTINYELRYTVAISTKTGAYKYIISDVYFLHDTGITELADAWLKKQISQMKEFMKAKSEMDF
jgi:hypothetical protein